MAVKLSKIRAAAIEAGHSRSTATKLAYIIWRDGCFCYWCGRPLMFMTKGFTQQRRRVVATLDHLQPRAKGGTMDPSNLVVACSECNGRRGRLHASDTVVFLKHRNTIVWVARAIIRAHAKTESLRNQLTDRN